MTFIDRRIRAFSRYLAAGRAQGLYCYMRVSTTASGPRVQAGGRELVMLASNNYLGLTTHPDVVRAAAEALKSYGSGAGSVRMLGGTMEPHLLLEARLAEFSGAGAAATFTSGYAANISVVSALVSKARDAIVMDEKAHASLADACRLAGLKPETFLHNDAADLERKLATLPAEKGRLVIVDGVYSVDGDIAPLDQIKKVCAAADAALLVDEAHSIGVLGPGGRGTPAHFGLAGQVDLVMGTLSKALGGAGGFVAGSAEVIDYIRHHARAFLFSTALPPATCAGILAALEVIKKEPERVERLRANIKRLRDGMRAAGYEVSADPTPIVPVIIGSDFDTYRVTLRLDELGVYAAPFIFPAVAKGRACLRLSAIATHSDEDIDRALEALAKTLPMVNEARARAGLPEYKSK